MKILKIREWQKNKMDAQFEAIVFSKKINISFEEHGLVSASYEKGNTKTLKVKRILDGFIFELDNPYSISGLSGTFIITKFHLDSIHIDYQMPSLNGTIPINSVNMMGTELDYIWLPNKVYSDKKTT